MRVRQPGPPSGRGRRLSDEGRRRLEIVADVMIPGGDGYPAASETTAVEFVDRRATGEDLAALEDLLREVEEDPNSLSAWLEQLEGSDPARFGLLRAHIYHGYYSSKRLLAALAAKGMEYRGAPQPLGFAVDRESPRPAAPRGSYVATPEVRRVQR